MRRVQDPDIVAQHLHIPVSVRHRLHIYEDHLHMFGYHLHLYTGESNKSQSIGMYWRNTVPSASWESLAGILYSLRINGALERVKEFLHEVRGTDLVSIDTICFRIMYDHSHSDPTLNVENMKMVMEELPVIPDLDVPHKITKRDTFTYQLSEDPVPYDECIQEYVYSHPCPSWSHITCQLQDMGFTEAAEKAAKYVKGLSNYMIELYSFMAV